ncbi:hypothetical protein HHL16_12075 [Pseudoflavitalea sp. G-6-1-2]|uniref:DoxX family protein n=1 Tax=Pseudoflavitalea sp. G-6-1-2 TaxID=2728841 RepID=UPI00146B6F9C|nr:MauE/DoxX family redox-associated membrane protein [Pseudoflavitalea sp. G-6-1-2]NML21618.1 hypothetical protein [Pseudoflavitalea sp. G-6-1-2]
MKPLIVLFGTFILGILISYVLKGKLNLTFNGNLAMGVMFCFTALGHFMFTKGMAMMIPPALPYRETAIFLSGIAEIVLGIALIIPQTRHIAAIAMIAMLVLILPANIYAAINRINYEKGTFDGPGLSYLWFRIPMQALLIGWIIYFGFRR